MKKYIIAAFVLVFGLGLAASAHASVNLSGNAWSSTVGWLVFRGTSTTGQTFGVSLATSTATLGTLSGAAWSNNIGWVSFNSADVASCVGSSPATVYLDSGKVTGWAIATAGKNRSDGWDGCIELSGTNHSSPGVGVSLSTTTGNFSGYSWGGTNVGWLSFVGVICPGCVGKTATTSNPTTPLTVSCSANPSSLNADTGSVTFTASTTMGTAPFSWTSGGSAIPGTTNQNSVTIGNYNAGTAGPTFMVTDSSNPVRTGSVSCAPVNKVIVGNPPSCTVPATAKVPYGDSTVKVTPTTSNLVSGHTYTPSYWDLSPSDTAYTLSIKDVTASPNLTYTCGSTLVSGTTNPPPNGDLKLMIGASNATLSASDYLDVDPATPGAKFKNLTIFRGQKFKVRWNVNESDAFTDCQSTIDHPQGWGLTVTPVSAEQVLQTTSSNALGKYNINMTCHTQDGSSKSSRVILNVLYSNVQEI